MAHPFQAASRRSATKGFVLCYVDGCWLPGSALWMLVACAGSPNSFFPVNQPELAASNLTKKRSSFRKIKGNAGRAFSRIDFRIGVLPPD